MKRIYSALALSVMMGLGGCTDGGGASTENPTITLQGDREITLAVNQVIDEPGYAANDTKDGDLTSAVKVTTDLNFYKAGQYTVNYSVKDSDGNVATASRIVNITQNGAQDGQYANYDPNAQVGSIPYDMATYGYNALVVDDGKTIQQTVSNYSSAGTALADTQVVFERNKANLTIYEYNNNAIENTDYIGFDKIQTISADDQSSLVYNRQVRVNEKIVNNNQLSCTIKEHLGTFNTGSMTGTSVPTFNYMDVLHMSCDTSTGTSSDTYFANGWGEVLNVISNTQETQYAVLDRNSMQVVSAQ